MLLELRILQNAALLVAPGQRRHKRLELRMRLARQYSPRQNLPPLASLENKVEVVDQGCRAALFSSGARRCADGHEGSVFQLLLQSPAELTACARRVHTR